MANRSPQRRKPTILSKDWGSTAVRASLYPRHQGALLREIWNQHPNPWYDERYQEGGFCPYLYLNDDGDGVYLGERIDLNRVATPSKPFFAEVPMTNNEFVKAALSGPRAKTMWERIDTGLKKIIETVFRQVVRDCNETTKGGPFYIDEIALAYPTYWTEVERKKYERLVREVLSTFEDECLRQVRPQIVFHEECLAAANNLFSTITQSDAVMGPITDQPPLLVTIDFGGHTLASIRWHFLTVPAEKAEQCFWKAMREPLERAAKEIARAASLKYDVRVVVYGGSGQNSIVQAKIKKACEKVGVKPPYFAQNGSRAKETWNVANGAAHAAAYTLSVEEFVSNGAAFGICKSILKPGARQSDCSPAIDWLSDVAVALDSTWCTSKTRLKIICDPFLKKGTKGKRRTLDIDRSYDVLELPQPPKGYWGYRLSFGKDGLSKTLVMELESLGKSGKPHGGSKIQHSFPLYVDGTSNCCLLNVDVDDEGRGLRLLEDGRLEACPLEARDEQLQHMAREESAAGVKRKRPHPRVPGVKPSGHLPPFKRKAPAPSAQTTQTLAEKPRSRHWKFTLNLEDLGDETYLVVQRDELEGAVGKRKSKWPFV
ncbi:hypothetical protein CCHR01_19033 [Colletotrichum chrysophilum]|uniref:Uncharacterized protein n=1 Tax=Colletotrichum chrysophilum TaxID=1836956 RepID=A0AAD8ZYZ3_9PEZI|nr:hypothetical protein CCHR01_19033 [Colletotrichum chrysophilum]